MEIHVTKENLDEVRENVPVVDQASALEPGCVTWPIKYSGGQRGQMTIWPNGRGGVALGGDSQWGDWDDQQGVLHLDDGGLVTRDGVFIDPEQLEGRASTQVLEALFVDASGKAWSLPCYRAVTDGVQILWTHSEEGIDDIMVGADKSLLEYAQEIVSGLGHFVGFDVDAVVCPDCEEAVNWGQIVTRQYAPNRIYGYCGCRRREWIQEERGGAWVLLGRHDTAEEQDAAEGQAYVLVVDLDERGVFRAHVEDEDGNEVFSFSNEDEQTEWPDDGGLWLVEDGFMRHGRDTDGLLKYLQQLGIVGPDATMSVRG